MPDMFDNICGWFFDRSLWTRIIIIAVALAIYTNIGFAFNHYADAYIYTSNIKAETIVAKFFRGPNDIFVDDKPVGRAVFVELLVDVCFWPLFILIVSLTWLVYGIVYILWLLFWGGIAKLLGFA